MSVPLNKTFISQVTSYKHVDSWRVCYCIYYTVPERQYWMENSLRCNSAPCHCFKSHYKWYVLIHFICEIVQTDWTIDRWLTTLRVHEFPPPSLFPWSGRGGVSVRSGGRVCAVLVGGVRGGVVLLQVLWNPTLCFTVAPRPFHTGHALNHTPTTIHLSENRQRENDSDRA